MNCPNCGTQIKDDSLFCEACGLNLKFFTIRADKKKHFKLWCVVCLIVISVIASASIFYYYPYIKDRQNGYIRLFSTDDEIVRIVEKSIVSECGNLPNCAFFTIISVPRKPNEDGQYICTLEDYLVNKQNGLFQFHAIGDALCDKDGKILGDDNNRVDIYDYDPNAWMNAQELANATIHESDKAEESAERKITEKALTKAGEYLQRKKIIMGTAISKYQYELSKRKKH